MIRIRAVLPLLILPFLLLPLPCVRAAEPAANGEPPAAKTYRDALQEAERDLRRMDAAPEPDGGGWRLSDYIGLVALLVAIGLMFWASRWTRRFFFRQVPGREMRILDRMAVGRNSSLLLVQLRGRVYWLAEHPGGVTRLDDWPADAPAPDAPAKTIPPGKGT